MHERVDGFPQGSRLVLGSVSMQPNSSLLVYSENWRPPCASEASSHDRRVFSPWADLGALLGDHGTKEEA